jgi:hypothetical protein
MRKGKLNARIGKQSMRRRRKEKVGPKLNSNPILF